MAFFDDHKPGELTSYLSSDVSIVCSVLGIKTANLINYLTSFIVAYILAFVQSWRLTLIMMAVMPVLIVSGACIAIFLSTATAKAQEAYAAAGGIAQEVLSAIRTVQAFNAGPRECARYNARVAECERISVRKGSMMGLSVGIMYAFVWCSYALAFFYGSYLVEWGLRSGGDVVSVFFCLMMGSFQLGAAGPLVASINEARGAAYKLFSIVDRTSAITAHEDGPGQRLPDFKGHIAFRDVSFAYPSRHDVPIFHGLDLEIEPGQNVALVGPSGCGKSSIIALMERFYDPDEGAVLVDGVPLRDVNLHWWRRQVGIVTQEPTLFSASILENILCANPQATR